MGVLNLFATKYISIRGGCKPPGTGSRQKYFAEQNMWATRHCVRHGARIAAHAFTAGWCCLQQNFHFFLVSQLAFIAALAGARTPARTHHSRASLARTYAHTVRLLAEVAHSILFVQRRNCSAQQFLDAHVRCSSSTAQKKKDRKQKLYRKASSTADRTHSR